MRSTAVFVFVLQGCAPAHVDTAFRTVDTAASRTGPVVDAVCAPTTGPVLPERFGAATDETRAMAAAIMRWACLARKGAPPALTFAQVDVEFFACDATRLYAVTQHDVFSVDWAKVCGGG